MLPAMRWISLGLLSLSLSCAVACKKSPESVPAPAAAPAEKPSLDKPRTLSERAKDVYRAKFATSKGDFVIEVHRDWAPLGADRFYNLVKNGYYNETRFFRVVNGFMAQIGIHGKPELNMAWRDQRIADDPVLKSNLRGFVSFATAGPGTRTTQFFINYSDGNSRLDGMGFAPFGQVTSGMEVVEHLYAEYGEGAPRGRGPDQGRLQDEGNAYLMRDFPQLDYVKEATILP
jgi:peptidyl-prolyl cis-trans isomerase A (cyclophilin A)